MKAKTLVFPARPNSVNIFADSQGLTALIAALQKARAEGKGEVTIEDNPQMGKVRYAFIRTTEED